MRLRPGVWMLSVGMIAGAGGAAFGRSYPNQPIR